MVEVFPIAADRWVAVIPTPAGEFSTEAASADSVAQEVMAAIREVLGEAPPHRLVDANGGFWTLSVAAMQMAELRE